MLDKWRCGLAKKANSTGITKAVCLNKLEKAYPCDFIKSVLNVYETR